jgi:hypothetical protein
MIDCSTEKYYNLFLDDVRDLNQAYKMTLDKDYGKLKWYIVRSYKEFCNFVELSFTKNKSVPILISFDHDLADEHYLQRDEPIPYDNFVEKTGYDCAKWLINFCKQNKIELPTYKIHSMNFVGEQNIENVFNSV